MNISANSLPGSQSALIRLCGVSRVYGYGRTALHALTGVDFHIASHDFVAVMGPSGSGKSTVMNIMGCLDTPTDGGYLFGDIHVGRLSRDQRARLRRKYIGFIFQGFNLLSRTSAQENVELPLLYRGERAPARQLLARRALAAVGLAGWEHHTPAELSTGQQQRVGVARAIVTSPALLLADEPTGSLDTQRSREVMELLLQLNTTLGVTVVMVTHDPNMANYARRVIHFVDGHVCSDVRTAPREAAPVSPGALALD